MGLMMCDGKFVSRDEIALVPTPDGTESWKPVPHTEVIDAVTDVVNAHGWQILDENFGLAREGQKMFGVMRINKSNSTDWSRCIGLRNSHDKSFAVGLSAGINVTVCSNLAFGGTTVIKRRHTSRIELTELIEVAMTELENEFLNLEMVCEDLKIIYLKNDDEASRARALVKSSPHTYPGSTFRNSPIRSSGRVKSTRHGDFNAPEPK